MFEIRGIVAVRMSHLSNELYVSLGLLPEPCTTDIRSSHQKRESLPKNSTSICMEKLISLFAFFQSLIGFYRTATRTSDTILHSVRQDVLPKSNHNYKDTNKVMPKKIRSYYVKTFWKKRVGKPI